MGRSFQIGHTLARSWFIGIFEASIFMVPEGAIRFCALTAFTNITGESPLAWERVQVEVH